MLVSSSQVLRSFWDDVAPEEISFNEFVWCVFGEELLLDEKEDDVTLLMSTRLAGNTNALSAFLADVRDWDAFRLLVRRRAGRIPLAMSKNKPERRTSSRGRRERSSDSSTVYDSDSEESASSSTVVREEAVRLLASEAFLMVIRQKEADWERQRIALEYALAVSERRLQRIIHAMGSVFDDAETRTPRTPPQSRKPFIPDEIDIDVPIERHAPSPPATPKVRRKLPRRLSKQVSFDRDTLRREKGKEKVRSALKDVWGEKALKENESDDEASSDVPESADSSQGFNNLWNVVSEALKSLDKSGDGVVDGQVVKADDGSGTDEENELGGSREEHGLYKLGNVHLVSSSTDATMEKSGRVHKMETRLEVTDDTPVRTKSSLDFAKRIMRPRSSSESQKRNPDTHKSSSRVADITAADRGEKQPTLGRKFGNLFRMKSRENLKT